jgi:hypothetical protein
MRGYARVAAAVLGAAVLAACSSGDSDVQAIEPTSEPTPQASPEPTEPEDPYAIPDEIDVAYVQSVLDVLVPLPDTPIEEALRTAPHDLPPDEMTRAIQASHSPDASAELLVAYNVILADAELAQDELADLSGSPSVWTVREIETARTDCIVFTFDYPSGAGGEDGAVGVLLAGHEDRDPGDRNPTPWVIDRTNFVENQSPAELEARCDVDQSGADDDGGEAAA